MNLKVLERHLLRKSSVGDTFVRAVVEVLPVAVLADCKAVPSVV